MRRAPGWIRLAGIALELTALAYIAYVLMDRDDETAEAPDDRVTLRYRRAAEVSKPEESADGPRYLGHAEPVLSGVEAIPRHDTGASDHGDPLAFIREPADAGARYYRASAGSTEILAATYGDGRIRLADAQNRHFAGLLQGNRADVLQLDDNTWSEVFVRVTPTGRMQLEMRGGPYDARVFTCDSLPEESLG